MKLIDIYSQLQKMNHSVFQTQDIAHYLKIDVPHASKLLARLCSSRQLIHLSRGLWALSNVDPLTLPQYLTAPFPSYISLQSALYFHGMISQIPHSIYVVSLARTRLYQTNLATFSIHHINPEFFFEFEVKNNGTIYIATPEKALLDVLYLSPAKSGLFYSLPELELPRSFSKKKALEIIDQIKSISRKSMVKKRFDKICL